MEKGMKFHRFFRWFLVGWAIVGILETLSAIVKSQDYYGAYGSWNVFYVILNTLCIIFAFISVKKLNEPDKNTYVFVQIFLALYPELLFVYMGMEFFEFRGKGFAIDEAFAGLLIGACLVVPISIYYYNRKDDFGKRDTAYRRESVNYSSMLRAEAIRDLRVMDELQRIQTLLTIVQDEKGLAARTNQYNVNQIEQKKSVESDWDCPACGRRNLKYDNICSKCGAKKQEPTAQENDDGFVMYKDDAVNEALSTMAEGIKGTTKNTENEASSERSSSYGLIPQQPIYTRGLAEQEKYLGALYTADGEKILWERIGATSVPGVYGMIDIYDTKRQNGEPYITLYINMYGSRTSTQAPNGFSFASAPGKATGIRETKPLTRRQWLAQKMGCDGERLTDTDNLAISSVMTAVKLRGKDKSSILCKNNLLCCDTALFTCFLVRALCIGVATNREAAMKFSDDFMQKIMVGIKACYLPDAGYYNDMFSNRMNFYDRVFMSKSGIQNKIDAITEEFGYILNTDESEGEYVAYHETSPLVLLGIDQLLSREAKIKEYVGNIPQYLSPYYEKVVHDLCK